MNTNYLPPWGFMEQYIEDEIENRPQPEAWRTGEPGSVSFPQWRQALVQDISSFLWPTYDPALQRWTSQPSASLLEADFDILQTVHSQLDNYVSGTGDPPTKHLQFFQEEDDENITFGVHYERYDPDVPQYLLDHFDDILWNGCNRKLASLHYQLKAQLQRPRPYQVAYLLGRNDYRYLWAKTGNTPSMVSGHCLQGSIAGCSAFLLFGTAVDIVSVGILQQFTVDIGDRRVFAGVHYPSDNLSSWYTALKLLPHVVDPAVLAPVRKFLWEAISLKSVVFKEVMRHINSYGGSPYRAAVEAIQRAATGQQADTTSSHFSDMHCSTQGTRHGYCPA